MNSGISELKTCAETTNKNPSLTRHISFSEGSWRMLEILKKFKGGNRSLIIREALEFYFDEVKRQGKLRLIE